MSNSKRTICLSEAEIREIQRQARAKLGECKKTQEIVGQQVFSILGFMPARSIILSARLGHGYYLYK